MVCSYSKILPVGIADFSLYTHNDFRSIQIRIFNAIPQNRIRHLQRKLHLRLVPCQNTNAVVCRDNRASTHIQNIYRNVSCFFFCTVICQFYENIHISTAFQDIFRSNINSRGAKIRQVNMHRLYCDYIYITVYTAHFCEITLICYWCNMTGWRIVYPDGKNIFPVKSDNPRNIKPESRVSALVPARKAAIYIKLRNGVCTFKFNKNRLSFILALRKISRLSVSPKAAIIALPFLAGTRCAVHTVNAIPCMGQRNFLPYAVVKLWHFKSKSRKTIFLRKPHKPPVFMK